MKKMILKVVLILSFLPLATAWGQSPVAIAVDLKAAGRTIPDDFSGLSFEMENILPRWNESSFFTSHLFRPDNKPLIQLFKTLGIKNLRLGGGSADEKTVGFIGNSEIDSLFAFAKAADVKVIYTLRLRDGDLKREAQMAEYIEAHYPDQLDCFAIGNEPDVYFTTNYPAFRVAWKKYADAIIAAAPGAKFCGPGGGIPYAKAFVDDFGKSGFVKCVTWHEYPGGFGPGTDGAVGREHMLSPEWLNTYQKLYHSTIPPAFPDTLPNRLEEANNFWGGGAENVSDTFASALWAVDYLYWWAGHGSGGINFHTGDFIPGSSRPFQYEAFLPLGHKGYDIHPLSYGMKTFDIGRHGNVLPLTITNVGKINLTAYAVRSADKNLFVTIINKEHDAGARAAQVTIAAGENISGAQVISLVAPHSDVAVKTGETLGGASINADGSWNGNWSVAPVPPPGSPFALQVPAASAVVVRLSFE
ncbi:MAG TPA: glycosyl hydrolase family 79 C-terminal domain-containing protein [Verrucomicrobiae bacterium]